MNDEQPRVIFIPNNYKSGINFMGFEIKIFKIVQAAVLAILPFIINFLVLPKYLDVGFSNTTLFSITVFFSAGLGYLGLIGINGMTIGEFVYYFVIFKRKQRKTYYNPRVKREILNIIAEEETREMLTGEKIRALCNSYKERIEKKNREQAVEFEEDSSFDTSKMFFEDDCGVVDKPVEYMTPKERKEYEKMQKKESKRLAKERKLEEKRILADKKRRDKFMKGN